jgi:hypothetical protein
MKKIVLLSLILVILGLLGFFIYYSYYNQIKTRVFSFQTQSDNGKSGPSNLNIDPATLVFEQMPLAPWEGRDSGAAVVFKDKIWFIGGVNGTSRFISPGNVDYGNAPHFSDIWNTEDGKTWTQVLKTGPWKDRRSMSVEAFNNKLWLFAGWGPEIGTKNDIWSSTDGINWTQEKKSANWPAREGQQVVVFKNKIWMMGGVKYSGHKLYNDVWSSSDGVNWTQETPAASWSPRWDFYLTAFDDKLWVINGMDFNDDVNNGLLSDVWCSEDGVDWVLVTEKAPFTARQGGFATDYNGKLFVIGRLNTPLYGSGPNDIWYTENGTDWYKSNKDPLWTGREDFGAVVFKGDIWVFGGMDKDWVWQNDVWKSTFKELSESD